LHLAQSIFYNPFNLGGNQLGFTRSIRKTLKERQTENGIIPPFFSYFASRRVRRAGSSRRVGIDDHRVPVLGTQTRWQLLLNRPQENAENNKDVARKENQSTPFTFP
jgi:hypothetical protein